MQLFGQYTLDKLVHVFQGYFGVMYDNARIMLSLFSLIFIIDTEGNRLDICRRVIVHGKEEYKLLITLQGK